MAPPIDITPKAFLDLNELPDETLTITLLVCDTKNQKVLVIVPDLEDPKYWLPDTRTSESEQSISSIIRDLAHLWTSVEPDDLLLYPSPAHEEGNLVFWRVDLRDSEKPLSPKEELKQALGEWANFSFKFVGESRCESHLGRDGGRRLAARKVLRSMKRGSQACPRCPGADFHTKRNCPLMRRKRRGAKKDEMKNAQASRSNGETESEKSRGEGVADE